MLKHYLLVWMLLLLFTLLSIEAAQAEKLYIGGQMEPIEITTYGDDNDTFLPLAPLLKPLGLRLEKVEGSFKLTAPQGRVVYFSPGSTRATVDHAFEDLDTAPVMVEGRLYLPESTLESLLMLRPLESDDEETIRLMPLLVFRDEHLAGRRVISVRSPLPLHYRKTMLATPPRACFDFSDLLFDEDTGNSGDVHEQLRLSRQPDHSTRLVLDLPKTGAVRIGMADGGRKLMISLPDTRPVATPASHASGKVVMLDAGHGGKDPGSAGADGCEEKTINLDVVLRAAKLLHARKVKVLLTREGDTYLDDDAQAEKANAAHADLFVIIHCNAWDTPEPCGTRTYYYSTQSKRLADAIHRAVVKKLGFEDGGVHQDDLVPEIYDTEMPSSLTELGFITNPDECKLLNTPAIRQKAAEAIADGICAYLAKIADDEE